MRKSTTIIESWEVLLESTNQVECLIHALADNLEILGEKQGAPVLRLAPDSEAELNELLSSWSAREQQFLQCACRTIRLTELDRYISYIDSRTKRWHAFVQENLGTGVSIRQTAWKLACSILAKQRKKATLVVNISPVLKKPVRDSESFDRSLKTFNSFVPLPKEPVRLRSHSGQ